MYNLDVRIQYMTIVLHFHFLPASLTALANAASPLAHPFFRHGAMPVSPFYPMLHPGMFPWPPVPGSATSGLAPATTEISSTAVVAPKVESQVIHRNSSNS